MSNNYPNTGQRDSSNEGPSEVKSDENKNVSQGSENASTPLSPQAQSAQPNTPEGRPVERKRSGARGTAAMDPKTRQEVARKGGLAVSRNKQHMAEIGRKGGQAVSKNREHMASIGRKGGEASRGHR